MFRNISSDYSRADFVSKCVYVNQEQWWDKYLEEVLKYKYQYRTLHVLKYKNLSTYIGLVLKYKYLSIEKILKYIASTFVKYFELRNKSL